MTESARVCPAMPIQRTIRMVSSLRRRQAWGSPPTRSLRSTDSAGAATIADGDMEAGAMGSFSGCV